MSGDEVIKRNDKVYFTFGRFNPPHSGHAKLIRQLAEDAGKDGDAYAFVTSSPDKNKNPLDVYTKVEYVKRQNPGNTVRIINTTEKNCRLIQQCVKLLLTAGYTEANITLVIGKDQYNAGSFNFLFKIYPAMKLRTTPLLNRSDLMTATEMRMAAKKGNLAKFQAGTQIGSMKPANSVELFQLVRQGLGLARTNRSRSRNRGSPKGTGTRRR